MCQKKKENIIQIYFEIINNEEGYKNGEIRTQYVLLLLFFYYLLLLK